MKVRGNMFQINFDNLDDVYFDWQIIVRWNAKSNKPVIVKHKNKLDECLNKKFDIYAFSSRQEFKEFDWNKKYKIEVKKKLRRLTKSEKINKIIFLDIDGVMSSLNQHLAEGNYGGKMSISKYHLKVLKLIIKCTGAKVVISSTWRRSHTCEELQKLLPKIPIIGKTPITNISMNRGNEIQQWLDENKKQYPNIKKFIILDDDSDMHHLMDHLIKTHCHYGLTHVEAIDCVKKLNGNSDRFKVMIRGDKK